MADRRTQVLVGIALASAVGLVVGWSTFWFLTDDAFIAFRYVANGVAGHGYVWNAPPFRPIDGYTSFSWVALLELTWRTTGVQPPEAANVLSLLFAFGQLYLFFRMVLGLKMKDERVRLPLLAIAVVGVLTNRTFLAWTSSGLETAMFNFAVLWWFYLAAWRGTSTARDCGVLVVAAVLIALTRPDGLLYLAATAAILVASTFASKTDRSRAAIPAWLGIGAVVLFLGWRVGTYGFLLPNTYYAKVVNPRPGLGLRYLGSFVLEYALWWWLALILAAAVLWLRTRPWKGTVSFARVCRITAAAVPILAVVAHAGYYTLRVGGDHFEYRVYSHLVPLIWVGAVWAAARIDPRPAVAYASLVGLVVCSWPVPWLHWAGTKHFDTRETSVNLQYSVAPDLPTPLQWYGEWFDAMQSHLIKRMTCMRHQEHKTFYEYKTERLPPREVGEAMSADNLPVHVSGEVGYVGWVLPNVAIIDTFGLNDYYAARNSETVREMTAHSRFPPPGYLEAFDANVKLVKDEWEVRERDVPLTDDDVRAIQKMYEVWLANLR